jgi:hypothetical protein
LTASIPVLQERGNVSNESKCATQIFKNFWVVAIRLAEEPALLPDYFFKASEV